jgi:signal transduction histidine kinase
VRPEGGSISIASKCHKGHLVITVQDDGPGEATDEHESHQLGLSSLQERLQSLFGGFAVLTTKVQPNGFEASFQIPDNWEFESGSLPGENPEHA